MTTDKPATCAACYAPARSIAAGECRASDCPLKSANQCKPAASTPVDEHSWYEAYLRSVGHY